MNDFSTGRRDYGNKQRQTLLFVLDQAETEENIELMKLKLKKAQKPIPYHITFWYTGFTN
jgi:hypothetical protein